MNPHCMQTHTGRVIDLSRFSEDDVDIEDIAHALAHIVRFTGHANKPYTVAQHSMLVCDLTPQPHKRWALLHDAAEAYFGDVSLPLKTLLPDYRAIEERAQKIIAGRFGMSWPLPAEVQEADREALLIEKRALFDKQVEWPGEKTGPTRVTVRHVLSPGMAKDLFLVMYSELQHDDR